MYILSFLNKLINNSRILKKKLIITKDELNFNIILIYIYNNS